MKKLFAILIGCFLTIGACFANPVEDALDSLRKYVTWDKTTVSYGIRGLSISCNTYTENRESFSIRVDALPWDKTENFLKENPIQNFSDFSKFVLFCKDNFPIEHIWKSDDSKSMSVAFMQPKLDIDLSDIDSFLKKEEIIKAFK